MSFCERLSYNYFTGTWILLRIVFLTWYDLTPYSIVSHINFCLRLSIPEYLLGLLLMMDEGIVHDIILTLVIISELHHFTRWFNSVVCLWILGVMIWLTQICVIFTIIISFRHVQLSTNDSRTSICFCHAQLFTN